MDREYIEAWRLRRRSIDEYRYNFNTLAAKVEYVTRSGKTIKGLLARGGDVTISDELVSYSAMTNKRIVTFDEIEVHIKAEDGKYYIVVYMDDEPDEKIYNIKYI